MDNRNNKKIVLIALLLAVLSLTLCYIALNQTLHLTVESTTQSHHSSWNIRFKNPRPGVATGSAERGYIDLNSTYIGIYNVTLRKKGDSVTYTFDVVNDGEINARLSTINKSDGYVINRKLDSDDYETTLTYNTGEPVRVGDVLNAGTSRTLKFTIRLNNNSLSNNDRAYINNLGYVLIYQQKG